jgi:hypothetical protein
LPDAAKAPVAATGRLAVMFDTVAAVGAVGCTPLSWRINLFLSMQHPLHDAVLFDQQVAVALA